MFKVHVFPLTQFGSGRWELMKDDKLCLNRDLAEILCLPQYNKFKCRILNEKVTTPTTTVYR